MKNLRGSELSSDSKIEECENDGNSLFWEVESLDILIDHLIENNAPVFLLTEIIEGPEENHCSEDQEVPSNIHIPDTIFSYNRKEKSLSELTIKFIEKFEGSKSSILALDLVTKEMNVERRRIYDIINIMESLGVVFKIKKNSYEWKGLSEAVKTIKSYCSGGQSQEHYPKNKERKEKSLGSLSTEFLRVFSAHRESITLEEASLMLLNDCYEDLKRTKIRRLYDIVNVFKCMGLIEKLKEQGSKPEYRWLGCDTLEGIIQNKEKNAPEKIDEPKDEKIDEFVSTPKTEESSKLNLEGSKKIHLEERLILKEESHDLEICDSKSETENKNKRITNPIRKSTLSWTSTSDSPFGRSKKSETEKIYENLPFLLAPLVARKFRSKSYEEKEECKKLDKDPKKEWKKKKIGSKTGVQLESRKSESYLCSILRKYKDEGIIEANDVMKKFHIDFWLGCIK